MIQETTTCRESALAGRLDFLNTGTGTAKVSLYGYPRASSVNDAPGTALIVAIDLDNPAGTVSSGALHLAAAGPGMVSNSGTPVWARVTNRNGDTAFDADAGIEGSGAECIISAADLFAGGLVTLVSAAIG